jgi:4-amino-4-deoxy-L-arabinose transferase-like glycosyltransferase
MSLSRTRSPAPPRATSAPAWPTDRLFFAALAVLTLARLLALWLSPLDLGPDEAQYWRWGQDFAWGYFSKPPLIGWAAGAASAIMGDTAFGVRWPAPLTHALAALGVWAFTGRAFGAQAGATAGLLYALAPGVTLSSALMSTDTLLLPAAAWALYAAQRLREGGGWAWGVALGGLIGVGLLAKYAAIYLIAGLVIGAALDPGLRRALMSRAGLTAILACTLTIAPNLLWNAANGGDTFRHTAANANLAGARFSLGEPLSWLGEQFGVFGFLVFPVGLAVAVVALVKPGHPARAWAGVALAPIATMLVIAWISRAHANWAAIAMPALCAVAADALTRWRERVAARGALWGIAGVQAAVTGVFLSALVSPALADRLGLDGGLASVRGWPAHAAAIEARARALGVAGVVVDTRYAWHGLDFHGRDWVDRPGGFPLRIWRSLARPQNTAESLAALPAGVPGRWLLVSTRRDYERYFREDFGAITPAGTIETPLGPRKSRVARLFLVADHRPLARDRLDTPPDEERAAAQAE